MAAERLNTNQAREDKRVPAIVDLAEHLANTGKMNINLSNIQLPEQNAQGGFVTQIPVADGDVYQVSEIPASGRQGSKHNIVKDKTIR